MEIQWALVLFTVVSGAGAWLFAFSMLGSLLKKDAAPGKMETITAFVLVAVGGCMSVMHLSHVDRILEALNHPTSGIFIEAAMIGVLCVILAVYFVLLARNSSEKARTAVGVLGLLVGMVFTYACGSSYLMEARPAWQTVTLPLAYFGTAASAGAGLNLLLKAVQKRDEQAVSFAGLMAVVGGALGAVLAAAFCIAAGRTWPPPTTARLRGWSPCSRRWPRSSYAAPWRSSSRRTRWAMGAIGARGGRRGRDRACARPCG